MIEVRSTDNFLPRAKAASSYVHRPATYAPRRRAIQATPAPKPLISDILPPSPPRAVSTAQRQPEIRAEQKPEVQQTLALDVAVSRKRRPSRKQLVSAFLTIALIIGAAASLMNFKGRPQPVQPAPVVKAAPAAVSTPSVTATGAQNQSVGWPVRLMIPKIAVDAPLDYVRITPEGALDAPKEPGNAGWFDKGARPGEEGTAIIDGHFGWRNNVPAVFDKLHTLVPGDIVQVRDERGQMISFVVRELRIYGKDQADKAVFVSDDNKAHLNLITCDGTWNEAAKSYTNRLVVFTDKQ